MIFTQRETAHTSTRFLVLRLLLVALVMCGVGFSSPHAQEIDEGDTTPPAEFERSDASSDGFCNWVCPVGCGDLICGATSQYSYPWDFYPGKQPRSGTGSFHHGLDIQGKPYAGQEDCANDVIALANSRVVSAAKGPGNQSGGLGGWIVLAPEPPADWVESEEVEVEGQDGDDTTCTLDRCFVRYMHVDPDVRAGQAANYRSVIGKITTHVPCDRAPKIGGGNFTPSECIQIRRACMSSGKTFAECTGGKENGIPIFPRTDNEGNFTGTHSASHVHMEVCCDSEEVCIGPGGRLISKLNPENNVYNSEEEALEAGYVNPADALTALSSTCDPDPGCTVANGECHENSHITSCDSPLRGAMISQVWGTKPHMASPHRMCYPIKRTPKMRFVDWSRGDYSGGLGFTLNNKIGMMTADPPLGYYYYIPECYGLRTSMQEQLRDIDAQIAVIRNEMIAQRMINYRDQEMSAAQLTTYNQLVAPVGDLIARKKAMIDQLGMCTNLTAQTATFYDDYVSMGCDLYYPNPGRHPTANKYLHDYCSVQHIRNHTQYDIVTEGVNTLIPGVTRQWCNTIRIDPQACDANLLIENDRQYQRILNPEHPFSPRHKLTKTYYNYRDLVQDDTGANRRTTIETCTREVTEENTGESYSELLPGGGQFFYCNTPEPWTGLTREASYDQCEHCKDQILDIDTGEYTSETFYCDMESYPADVTTAAAVECGGDQGVLDPTCITNTSERICAERQAVEDYSCMKQQNFPCDCPSATSHEQCCNLMVPAVPMDNILKLRQLEPAYGTWDEYAAEYPPGPHYPWNIHAVGPPTPENDTRFPWPQWAAQAPPSNPDDCDPGGCSTAYVNPFSTASWPEISYYFSDNFGGISELAPPDGRLPVSEQPYMEWWEEALPHCEGWNDAIVGIGSVQQQCKFGGWEEMMMYQARCYAFFNVRCICNYDQTFKRGSAEEYVLQKAGALIAERNYAEVQNRRLARKDDHFWALGWRGYVSDPELPLPNSLRPEGMNRRFPFANGEYNKVMEAMGKTLDQAVPGDILIWDVDTIKGTKRQPHVAYVVNAHNDVTCTAQCTFNPNPDIASSTCVCGGSSGTAENPWVEVMEYDYGKFPDQCMTTDRWGTETRRTLYKEPLPESYTWLGASFEITIPQEIKDYNPTLSCAEPSLNICYEELWEPGRIKVYDPRIDVRRNGNIDDSTPCNPLLNTVTSERLRLDKELETEALLDLANGCDPPTSLRPDPPGPPVGSLVFLNIASPDSANEPFSLPARSGGTDDNVSERAPRLDPDGSGGGGSAGGGEACSCIEPVASECQDYCSTPGGGGPGGPGGPTGGEFEEDACGRSPPRRFERNPDPLSNKWAETNTQCKFDFPSYTGTQRDLDTGIWRDSYFYSADEIARFFEGPPYSDTEYTPPNQLDLNNFPEDLQPRNTDAVCSRTGSSARCSEPRVCALYGTRDVIPEDQLGCDAWGHQRLQRLSTSTFQACERDMADPQESDYRNNGYSRDFVVDYLIEQSVLNPEDSGDLNRIQYMLEKTPIEWLSDLTSGGDSCWMIGDGECGGAAGGSTDRSIWVLDREVEVIDAEQEFQIEVQDGDEDLLCKFYDEDGNQLNFNGQLINEDGQAINEDGELVNENGVVINLDEDGNLIDPATNALITDYGVPFIYDNDGTTMLDPITLLPINAYGTPLVYNDDNELIDPVLLVPVSEWGVPLQYDQEDNLINEDGERIDERGRRIDDNGNLIDEEGRIIDQFGNYRDEDGNFVDTNGEMTYLPCDILDGVVYVPELRITITNLLDGLTWDDPAQSAWNNIIPNQTVVVFASEEYFRGQTGIVVGADPVKGCVDIVSSNWLDHSCSALGDDQLDVRTCYQSTAYFARSCQANCIPVNNIALMFNP